MLKGEEIMAKYVLMLRDNGTYDSLSPEELQKIFEKFRSWSGKLREQGKITGGQKLRDRQGRVVRRNGSKESVTDGPFAEAKEVIGGFFVVDAKDYDEAVSLSRGCPHLEFGSIEIREIDPTVNG
jgi:hypothetical protein